MSFQNKLDLYNIQDKWQKIWKDNHIYRYDKDEIRENIFSIDTPPPTVSGSLHMGHVFSYTQVDFIARFQRMLGKSVFYPIGFDDNGLPTERLVEKVKKIRAKDVGRENFIKLCEEVVLESEEDFRKVFKSLGLSFDWKEEFQTISTNSRKLSQMSFLDLYNKDKITRKFGPSFWDVKDQTAIAQAENIDKEQQGILNDIVFQTVDNEEITISTTRPEMLPACVAIFYHPEDARYLHLKNKEAITPLFLNKVKILPDEHVEIEKGTGLVMCCTFGDIQDINWWREYNLDTKECISKYGKMQNSGILDGMKLKEAREFVIQKLKEEKKLTAQKEVVQNVKCAERSGAILEIIPTSQWFIKVLGEKEELHKKNEECNWHPPFMKERLTSWIDGLNQDWCISRQRYFGVPFPVWYSKRSGEEGKILLAEIDQLPVDPSVDLPKGYSKDEVEPEYDVMDTWATSSITPQLSTLYINDQYKLDESKHDKIFPFDLRPQAHEIIRTWAFGTIVKSMYHQNSIPWKNLMISGWCLASDKSKMSKSKGNSIAPEKLISEQGADVIRYWASNSKLGMDITFNNEVFKIGKKLVNKLWNAGKFLNTHLENSDIKIQSLQKDIHDKNIVCDIDLWILSSLHQVVLKTTESFKKYEYSEARSTIENFFWKHYCDNYIELIKTRIYSEDDNQYKRSAILTLSHVFNTLLKLFSPILPHITDELYSLLFKEKNEHSISARNTWPKLEEFYFDPKYIILGADALNVIELVRKYKSNKGLALNTEINEILYNGPEISDSAMIDLKNASNAKSIVLKEIQNTENDNIIKSACEKYTILIQEDN
ncbi:MAG: valyl-tRNA synthetase [Candidatus Midichloriaceae bacterium]|jgi:valyl-tRNA synthetase